MASSSASDSASGEARARSLLGDPPRLHRWGGGAEPIVGGLSRPIGERMIAEVTRYDAPRIIETGAGVSTLLLSCLEPESVTSIDHDQSLMERLLAEAAAREIPTDSLRLIQERSETALPRLAADGERFDVGFIDGCHNWPGVFVDFCYINMMMPAGGTLLLDDVHLFSVAQLHLLLRQQEEFEYLAMDDKCVTYRKVLDHPFLAQWRWQPYIERNTVLPPPSPPT